MVRRAMTWPAVGPFLIEFCGCCEARACEECTTTTHSHPHLHSVAHNLHSQGTCRKKLLLSINHVRSLDYCDSDYTPKVPGNALPTSHQISAIMAGSRRSAQANANGYAMRQRVLRSYRNPPSESDDASDSEPPAANTGNEVYSTSSSPTNTYTYTHTKDTGCRLTDSICQLPQSEPANNSRDNPFIRASPRQTVVGNSRQAPRPLLAPTVVEQPASTTNIDLLPASRLAAEPSGRGRGNRRSLFMRNRRRGSSDRPVASPPRGNAATQQFGFGYRRDNMPDPSSYEYDLAMALEQEMLGEERSLSQDESDRPDAWRAIRRRAFAAGDLFTGGWDDAGDDPEIRIMKMKELQNAGLDSSSPHSFGSMSGAHKRSRDRFEASETGLQRTLKSRGAVAVVLYRNAIPNAEANDIWPQCRSAAKLPVRYYLLDKDKHSFSDARYKQRPQKMVKRKADKGKQKESDYEELPDAHTGRPKWDLPVELVELIAGYLNRDDIKSLRMVSHELNYHISQVIFKTVVVPFNTEIYGMLAQGQKPDFKGKNRAKLEKPGYSWKNSNGDEVYNGHGLDVFRGFGRHILRYGMSFEVSEDSLSQPPAKALTEKKTSFWGAYDWPFEEYRRFDAVAGLETAADETPRMKIAFSELTRIKELALSVDSGLGWLNGPDRSIRARILQRPPAVFGTLKDVPDRRAQAQQELWSHMERRHQESGQDIRLATLYRADGLRPPSELEENGMLADDQPEMPYLDSHIIHETTPHDTNETTLPSSFDDPEVLDRFVLTPATSGSGILFSSTVPPSDTAQMMSPIIPAHLTKAQKEWLLETEWAQRAFMSSYMLSIIDNPTTFTPVHTLNISRLSDRYLSALNRPDFWNALPNLTSLTLLVIPGWRTVQKDEAGFVDTSRINPITGLDPFCELLSNQVVDRPGIRNLTLGWIGGGEHAQGLYARNKLIMPAPIMPLGSRTENAAIFASDMTTEMNPERLRSSLLQFPHVERLTLKNCWINPSALLQFVKIHDTKNLQHLTLNSVSLTAVLRPIGNGNQVAAHGNALNAPAAGFLGANVMFNVLNGLGGQAAGQGGAQALPNNNQLLQWLVQSLQAQLQHLQANATNAQTQNQMAAIQTQLQQQIQQLQSQAQAQQQAQPVVPPVQNAVQPVAQTQPQIAANQLAVTALATQVQAMQQQAAVPAQPNAAPPANPQALLNQPREGSWMSIIDMISPGTNLGDFDSNHSKADPDRQTSLRSIEFISCGYAKLPHTTFDQAAIEHGNGITAALRNPMFSKRSSTLMPAMLSAKWAHLGEIVQEVDLTELAALDAGWNMKTGWEDAEEARAVEFDGALPGGTGRFTGRVQAGDRMRDADEAGSGSAS